MKTLRLASFNATLENKEQTDRLLIALKRLVLLVRSSINRFYAQNILTSALGTLVSLESTRNNQIALQLQTTDKKSSNIWANKKTAVICFAFGFRAE